MKRLKQLLTMQPVVIVGVVHDLNLAAQFADHLVLIHEGKVLASGSPGEVLTVSNIRTAYQVEPIILEHSGSQVFLFK